MTGNSWGAVALWGSATNCEGFRARTGERTLKAILPAGCHTTQAALRMQVSSPAIRLACRQGRCRASLGATVLCTIQKTCLSSQMGGRQRSGKGGLALHGLGVGIPFRFRRFFAVRHGWEDVIALICLRRCLTSFVVASCISMLNRRNTKYTDDAFRS